MIGRLRGVLIEKTPPTICIDVQGVGYELDVPMSTFYHLPELNQEVMLFTHLSIRDDAHVLYGFGNDQERQTFRQLIKVSGIGARTALSILSGLNATELATAIEQEDSDTLIQVPGIGKKTAQRLLLELRGKLVTVTTSSTEDSSSPTAPTSHKRSDIENALLALGYNQKEINRVLKDIDTALSVEESIRQALQRLAGRSA
ncbi:MAG TPA: Holliday junction branch migration protein RuvA [Paenalcaligenes sp.]|nr:Holliday junction branch migration protein RuvA [Paenalcaligenes sp.]